MAKKLDVTEFEQVVLAILDTQLENEECAELIAYIADAYFERTDEYPITNEEDLEQGFKDGAKARLNVTTISDCPIKDEEESKYKTAYIKGIRTMANALKDYDRTDGAWTDYFEHTVDEVLKRLLKEIE